jgi:hypothetical protein
MQISNVIGGYSLGERRPAAPRDGQEGRGRDGQAARDLHGRAQPSANIPKDASRRDLRPDGQVRRIRLQQVALRRLLAARVSHRLAQDPLSSRVHGRAAHQRNLEARKRRQVHLRVPRDEHPRRPARRAGLRRQLHPHRRRDRLRPRRHQERRPQRHRIHHHRAHRAYAQQGSRASPASGSSARRSISACSTSASSNPSSRPARWTPSAPRARSPPRSTRPWSAPRNRSATQPPASTASSASSTTHPANTATPKNRLPAVPDWDEHTRLQNEKEVLGFFVSGHPWTSTARSSATSRSSTPHRLRDEARAAVFRRGQRRPQNEISDRRRHHRPQGRQVQTLRRDVRAGRARRHRRQDRTHRLLRSPTKSSPRN